MKLFRRSYSWFAAGLVVLGGLLFLARPSIEQTIVSQSGPVITVGSNLSDKTAYTFLVGVLPTHTYEFLVIGRGPGTLGNPWNTSTGLQWSPDPISASGQAFQNVNGFFQLQTPASTQITTCITTAITITSGQSQLCALSPVPARTIRIQTRVQGAGNFFDLVMIDVTGEQGLPFSLAPTNCNGVVSNLSNVAGSPCSILIAGSDNNTARTLNTNANGQLFVGTGTASDGALASSVNTTASAGGEPISVMPTLEYRVGSAADAVFFQRGISKFTSATATASGNTAVWTPTASGKFRLICVGLDVSQNVAAASAGVLSIQLEDGASAIPGFQWSVFVPSAAGTTFGAGYHEPLECFPNGFVSSTANNVLNVNLSFALTAGNVTVRAYGTDE